MATIRYTGKAPYVAQVDTISIGGTLTTQTFQILVNSIVMATFTSASSTAQQIADGLVAAWNAATHPYALYITAASGSNALTLTADTAGVPFTISLNTPGGGATFSRSATVVNSSPSDMAVLSNYDPPSALPGSVDKLVLKDCDVHLAWNLDAITSCTHIEHHTSFTGNIGLDYASFAISADGQTVDVNALEYRVTHLTVSLAGTTKRLDIGLDQGLGAAKGPKRILFNMTGTNTKTIEIWNLNSQSQEGAMSRPVLRMKTASGSNATLILHNIPGGVGLATEKPGEIADFLAINGDDNASNLLLMGAGCVWAAMDMKHGSGKLAHTGGTITSMNLGNGRWEFTEGGNVTITTVTIGTGCELVNRILALVATTMHNYGHLNCTNQGSMLTMTTWKPKAGSKLSGTKFAYTTLTLTDIPKDYVLTFDSQ